ncbi:MAG: DNA mismatch repair endonuclease MutL [Clostridiales bacterium]|nr:DNA mismatch repair endonuclease MutL [Clostridiales bacterium]
MSVINILDKSVFNKIAAGEVVEKPASVVKELVENSIDAGASSISIEILDGGITYIKVSDNGKGIAYDDFDKVFLPHATSKVKTVDDLSKIGTLGFRGEALSSISSVSRVTMASKTGDDDSGYQIKVSGGDLGEIIPIGATQGTYMMIEDLFYNIPARKKFLRKPKLEENDITNYIARLIMANPNISIKYSADNKVIYQSFGTGVFDAIYAVYGKNIVDNIAEFSFEKGDYKFSGYLGKPTFSKPNRTYQTLIVNGRYVINQTISTAVYKAYENFLMKGNFPFYVIYLDIPLDKIDVNVHPNKLDVKFEDSNQLFGIVYNGVIDFLYNLNNTKTISLEVEDDEPEVDKSKLQILSDFTKNIVQNFNSQTTNINDDNVVQEVNLSKSVEYEINKEERENNEFVSSVMNSSADIETVEKIIPFFTDSTLDFKVQSPHHNEIKEVELDVFQKVETENISILEDNTDIKIVGTLFDTYILIEKEGKLIIIDQHAGHERLLFDKFTSELNSKEVAIQPLLVPYILETNYQENLFINDNLDNIKELGFDIEDFGDNSYKISTVPLLFRDVNVNEFFDNILSDLDNKIIVSKDQTIREYLAKSACKAAVKGNDKLSENEIKKLVIELHKPNQVLLCPHGRPIFIEFTQKEIEKWFKRIV